MLLFLGVQCSATFRPKSTVFLIVVEKSTPVAKNWKLLGLKSHPLWLCFSGVHHSSSAQGLGDIQLDSHPEVATPAFSSRGSINMFNRAQGFPDSFGNGLIHEAKERLCIWTQKEALTKVASSTDSLLVDLYKPIKYLSKVQGPCISSFYESASLSNMINTVLDPKSRASKV